jgi:hypothetical protein
MLRISAKKNEYGGRVHMPNMYECTDEDGNPMHGISAADIRLRPDEIATATIKLFMEWLDIEVKPAFHMQHPVTGEDKQIREIIYTDGTRWEAI